MKPNTLALLFAGTAAPIVAYSQVYLSETEATQSLFPGKQFTRTQYVLSDAEKSLIEKASGENVRNTTLAAWVSSDKSMVFIDQVLGKHEFITYAVAITPDKKVQGIEILEYRETYGQQVQGKPWRNQFVGKGLEAKLKLTEDIINISGATLSCAHVTAGVRRVLQTYEQLRKRI